MDEKVVGLSARQSLNFYEPNKSKSKHKSKSCYHHRITPSNCVLFIHLGEERQCGAKFLALIDKMMEKNRA